MALEEINETAREPDVVEPVATVSYPWGTAIKRLLLCGLGGGTLATVLAHVFHWTVVIPNSRAGVATAIALTCLMLGVWLSAVAAEGASQAAKAFGGITSTTASGEGIACLMGLLFYAAVLYAGLTKYIIPFFSVPGGVLAIMLGLGMALALSLAQLFHDPWAVTGMHLAVWLNRYIAPICLIFLDPSVLAFGLMATGVFLDITGYFQRQRFEDSGSIGDGWL